MALACKEESQALYLAMTRYKPAVLENNVVEVYLDNTIQAELIQEKKPELLSRLHQSLENHAIQIRTKIQETQTTEKVYLPKDKLQKLIQKNPEINRLTKELGLDIEY